MKEVVTVDQGGGVVNETLMTKFKSDALLATIGLAAFCLPSMVHGINESLHMGENVGVEAGETISITEESFTSSNFRDISNLPEAIKDSKNQSIENGKFLESGYSAFFTVMLSGVFCAAAFAIDSERRSEVDKNKTCEEVSPDKNPFIVECAFTFGKLASLGLAYNLISKILDSSNLVSDLLTHGLTTTIGAVAGIMACGAITLAVSGGSSRSEFP